MKLITIFSTFLIVNTTFANCLIKRAAFDIGSGTTKVKVATVDKCLKKVITVLHSESIQVRYSKDLERENSNDRFSDEIIAQGIIAISTLKKKIEQYEPQEYLAVATEAFRKAKNQDEAAKRIISETGINFKIITQQEEAILGFIAGSATIERDPTDVIVWDIGGGSMQMVSYEDGHYHTYKGQFASEAYKDSIVSAINLISRKKERQTPNPLKKFGSLLAFLEARLVAKIETDDKIKEKIINGASVIGVGSLHSKSVLAQLETSCNEYTFWQLIGAAYERSDLTDEEINSPYADTQTTNLLLVSSFMNAYKIKKVQVADVNLADGILINNF